MLIVKRAGTPVAALVPISLYQDWRDSVFDRISASAERSDMTEEEAMALALEAVAKVRAERPLA